MAGKYTPESAMEMAMKAGDPAAAIDALKECGFTLKPIAGAEKPEDEKKEGEDEDSGMSGLMKFRKNVTSQVFPPEKPDAG